MGQSESRRDQNRRYWLSRWFERFCRKPTTVQDLLEYIHGLYAAWALDTDALDMVEGVLTMSDLRVRDIMISRARMRVINRHDLLTEMIQQVLESGHSRYPVIDDNRDEVDGILLAKDLLNYSSSDDQETFDIDDVLRVPFFVPESKRLNTLLAEFRHHRTHMAIVVNEYGGIAGLVTIEDVLERIVGDIGDEHDTEDDSFVTANHDGSYNVNALMPIAKFNDYFGSEFGEEEYDTVGGLLVSRMGHMPKPGESVTIGRFGFVVMNSDARRVEMMRVLPMAGTVTHEVREED